MELLRPHKAKEFLEFALCCAFTEEGHRESTSRARHVQQLLWVSVHVPRCCYQRVGEDVFELRHPACDSISSSVLYFNLDTREVVVTMTLDAMEKQLYFTV